MTRATPGKKRSRAVWSELCVKTERRTQLLDVTAGVVRMVRDSGVRNGVCHINVPHTTAGVTINESDDPSVARDIEAVLDRMVPKDAGYSHAEGNADAHVKATLVGASATLFIAEGQLGISRWQGLSYREWQGIFLCEFDGPRERLVRVKIVSD